MTRADLPSGVVATRIDEIVNQEISVHKLASRSLSLTNWTIAVCIAAAVLRILAARGELWLDEVWTIDLVRNVVDSPADVVFKLRHDNNHFLNSWVAYLVGPGGEAWQYRWPAVLAGTATVLLAGWVQRRLGRPASLAAMVLVGFSYLLVHYSSEARGYAYLMCFLLLAYGALVKADQSGRKRWEFLIAASCVLGVLAHPLFLNLYLAIQVWTYFPDGKRTDWAAFRRMTIAVLLRTLLPGLFYVWLYWVNLRRMQIGGGDVQPYFQILSQTLSLTCGGPFAPPLSYVAAAITVVVTSAALWYVFRQSLRRGSFYAAAIFVMPTATLIALPRGDIYPRYFLGSVLFIYLLWSELAGYWWERKPRGQYACAALLAAFVLVNGIHVGRLIEFGRSSYQAALERIDQQTAAEQIVALIDHPFRQRTMLDFHAPRTALSKPLQYSVLSPDTAGTAEWLLAHKLEVGFQPPEALRLEDQFNFELVEHYPFAGLSGWHLCVYRRHVPLD